MTMPTTSPYVYAFEKALGGLPAYLYGLMSHSDFKQEAVAVMSVIDDLRLVLEKADRKVRKNVIEKDVIEKDVIEKDEIDQTD